LVALVTDDRRHSASPSRLLAATAPALRTKDRVARRDRVPRAVAIVRPQRTEAQLLAAVPFDKLPQLAPASVQE
jgi:hypothetical protein